MQTMIYHQLSQKLTMTMEKKEDRNRKLEEKPLVWQSF